MYDLELTIIVVSYNTRDTTLECIRSVLEHVSCESYEILVFDNASTDGSAMALRERFGGRLKLIESTENLGFARGNNLAAAQARGRRLLLLNPDTVVLEQAIDNLLTFAHANPECRIWGGRTVFADGTLNPTSCWGAATLWSIFCFATGLTKCAQSRLFNSEGYGGWKRDPERSVDI